MITLSAATELEQPWDDIRAQFVGHPTLTPLAIDLLPDCNEFKQKFSKASLTEKAQQIRDVLERNKPSDADGETPILTTADKEARARATAAAKARVPSNKMSTPLRIESVAGALSSAASMSDSARVSADAATFP